MSNPLAIAAVTATLRNLLQSGIDLDPDLGGSAVTTRPPDKARGANDTGGQLNVFLYHTGANAAWRNQDMPGLVKGGETGQPPLALTLCYLVTAYGKDNDDVSGHHLLGRAMSLLHDQPVLLPADIQSALPHNDLWQQVERVRLTPQPLPLEELSKLWTAFQTQYRISAAYQASVVLVDSARLAKSAPPVLQRGKGDRGPVAVGGPSPWLAEVRPPGAQPSIRLGEDLAVLGRALDGGGLTAQLSSQRLPSPVTLAPEPGGTESQVNLRLRGPADDPDALARWAPGFYTLSFTVSRPGLPPWATNEVPFTLAPTITVAPATAAAGSALTVLCSPRLRPGQRVLLLFGDGQVAPAAVDTPADPAQPSQLGFVVPALPSGLYLVRLRVDGVDSLPVILAGDPPVLQFDPAQQVTIP